MCACLGLYCTCTFIVRMDTVCTYPACTYIVPLRLGAAPALAHGHRYVEQLENFIVHLCSMGFGVENVWG